MRPLFLLQVFAIVALAGGCAPRSYTPYYSTPDPYRPDTTERDQVTLERTACFGFCPIYKVTVDERDILLFEGERFVAEADGAISKRLAEGSFNRLVEILRAYDFTAFDAAYPNEAGSNCPQLATDSPSVIIAADAGRLDHAVSFYQGCAGFEARERLEQMIAEIDALLAIDDLVGPREDFYGAKE